VLGRRGIFVNGTVACKGIVIIIIIIITFGFAEIRTNTAKYILIHKLQSD